MPTAGHRLRIMDVYPLKDGGRRTAMHRTRMLDYVVVIEGELVLILDDSEVILKPGSVLPVVEAGLADIVESSACVNREIEDGIWLEDAAGHSPGSVVVNAQRSGARAVFTGDIVHHPIQLVRRAQRYFSCDFR